MASSRVIEDTVADSVLSIAGGQHRGADRRYLAGGDVAGRTCTCIVKIHGQQTRREEGRRSGEDTLGDGTLYGEYAEALSEGNYIPKEFHIEAIKTAVGAIAGNQLYGDRKGMESARQYCVLVGQIGGGKGTAIRGATDLFKFNFENVGSGEGDADFIWSAGKKPKWGHIGTVLTNAGSEPGLYEAGMTCARVLLNPAELDGMMSKTHIQGSGAALLSQLRELFDSPWVVPSVTAGRKIKKVPKIMYLSLLTSTQPSTFEELISEGLGTGLLSRLTIVSNSEARTVPSLPHPCLRKFLNQIVTKLEGLENIAFRAHVGSEANEVLNKWWAGIMDVARSHDTAIQREITTRLNIVVLRNAVHLAWLLNESTVSAETMRKACRLGDYQLSQRSALIGTPTENPIAKIQQKIRKVLRQRGSRLAVRFSAT